MRKKTRHIALFAKKNQGEYIYQNSNVYIGSHPFEYFLVAMTLFEAFYSYFRCVFIVNACALPACR